MSSKSARNTGFNRHKPRRCLDCGATLMRDGHIRHEQTCPIDLGMARIIDDDRAYFAANPLAHIRVREPVMAEIKNAMLALGLELPDMGLAVEPGGYVIVTQIAPGVRMRHLSNVELIATSTRKRDP